MNKREKYTNKMQIEAMVDVMKKNKDIACGFSQRVPADIKKFWEELTLILNGSGPPLKDSSGWKKVWTDYKSGVKKKLTKNKQVLTGTGGGPYKEIPLTDTEEEVRVLLSLNTAINGMANVSNFGVSKSHETSSVAEISPPLELNICPQETDLPLEEIAVTIETSTQNSSSANIASRPLKRARKEDKPALLKEQINIQKKLASDVASALEIIKDQNKENHKSLKDIKRAIYILRDEKKKQTKILEQQLAEEKRHNNEMKELLIKKIALKERILQIEIEKLDKELQ